jgi:uncharacterized protein YodC (DUF2158 family)
MTYEAGNIVTLKSGGQPMTVVAVSGDDIECIWIGEEGEFFRQTIPAVALEAITSEEDETEDEVDGEEEEENGDDEDAEDEEEVKAKPKAGRAA